MNKDEILAGWAEKTTYSKEELDELLKGIYTQERKDYPDEKEDEAKDRSIALLRAKLKREFLGGTTNVRFWIIAVDGLSDYTARRYQNAKALFGKDPEVEVIHAGLECGIIGSKFPGMDMISFGPTIQNPHSPDERVNIQSIGKVWDFLVALLKTFK